MGRLFTTLNGYDICHNEEEIIEASGYDPDRDLEIHVDLFSVPMEPGIMSHGMRYQNICI